jgi:hypothetical protein
MPVKLHSLWFGTVHAIPMLPVEHVPCVLGHLLLFGSQVPPGQSASRVQLMLALFEQVRQGFPAFWPPLQLEHEMSSAWILP